MSLPERKIRFKEHQPGRSWEAIATEHQRTYSDATLATGPFGVTTDSNGFIESGLPKDVPAPTLMVLGDSVVENLFVAPEERMCRAMERCFQRLGQPTRVLNGGVSGASTLHSLHVITGKVIPMRPKQVLIMNGVIDSDCLTDIDSYWSKHEWRDPLSYAYKPADEGQRGTVESSPQDRKRLLRMAVMALREFDIEPLFATFHRRSSWATDEVLQRAFREHQFAKRMAWWDVSLNAMRSVAGQMNVRLFDVTRQFEGRTELLYDEIHMNARGAEEIGGWLAGRIAEQEKPKC